MNIFFLDEDPVKAAQAQVDKHVVKMILESAQLLCTTHHVLNTGISVKYDGKFYRKTHFNHPCAKWVRKSIENYRWLVDHALALCEEYTYRYGKIHASMDVIRFCAAHEPNLPSNGNITEPAMAMPIEHEILNEPVESYRNYYKNDKMQTIQCNWTKRTKPEWI